MIREFTNSTGRWSLLVLLGKGGGLRCLEKVSAVMRREERLERRVLRLER
jgi:hypothetical protein